MPDIKAFTSPHKLIEPSPFDERALDHVLAVTRRVINQYVDIAEQVMNGTMTAEQANAATRALNGVVRKIKVRS
jgi:hypothetical protein